MKHDRRDRLPPEDRRFAAAFFILVLVVYAGIIYALFSLVAGLAH